MAREPRSPHPIKAGRPHRRMEMAWQLHALTLPGPNGMLCRGATHRCGWQRKLEYRCALRRGSQVSAVPRPPPGTSTTRRWQRRAARRGRDPAVDRRPRLPDAGADRGRRQGQPRPRAHALCRRRRPARLREAIARPPRTCRRAAMSTRRRSSSSPAPSPRCSPPANACWSRATTVLVPEPMYVTYPATVAAAGARIVRVPLLAERGFHLDLDALAAAVTPATRAILLNSPHNPPVR